MLKGALMTGAVATMLALGAASVSNILLLIGAALAAIGGTAYLSRKAGTL